MSTPELHTETLFSHYWYRVADLKPRIRSQADFHRHVYRGELWYVLQDHASGRHYRFSPVAYGIIALMDGEKSVHELWLSGCKSFGDEAPTQDEMIRLLGQLHASDVLLCDLPSDTLDLFFRSERLKKSKVLAKVRSPLFLRFPLWDPEIFLSKTVAYVRFLFSYPVFWIWLAVIVSALVTTGLVWDELTHNIADRVLSGQNLVVLWLVYPAVKALHELGHAYALKRWGGEVHEMGFMLLVLMPVPYVEASSASSLSSKRQRFIVGAAGIMVEMFVASLALLFWTVLEPGLLRTIAFNVAFIGGISTVLFNGNPLLRYDGYYMLMDYLEIPNLAQRSYQYLAFMAKRYLLGMRHLSPPYCTQGERAWLIGYSIAAFIYRIFVYAAIILFVAGKFFVVGVILACWAAINMILWPLLKRVHFLLFSPVLREQRPRALGLVSVVLLGLVVILFAVPFPSWTNCEGVVTVKEESMLRAPVPGFIATIVATPNQEVEKNDLLIRVRNLELSTEKDVLSARFAELESMYALALTQDRVQVQILEEELEHVRSRLARVKDKVASLELRSPHRGMFVLPEAEKILERFVSQGELIGYVLAEQSPLVSVVVGQEDIDLVRRKTRKVRVLFADRLTNDSVGTLIREVPGATERLPNTVLGFGGGGKIAVDPTDVSGTKTFEKSFLFDVEVESIAFPIHVGKRAYVRFEHTAEPLGFQWYRAVRQIFLKRFNV